MKYFEQREAFKRLIIQQGISKLEQLNQALPFGCDVPKPLIDRWLNRMTEVPVYFSDQRRYVNRFKLGADPEFIFVKGGERYDAKSLKLQQGLAFGMDNNGRLTEIRPYPSRSALNVTASILATLRWMALLRPETLQYEWCAGAFLFGDGLGGHVHFGRKRPGRDLEVRALDAVEEELMAIKAYPVAECMRRRQGDAHHQLYGQLGDIRKQLHGYEYRTFPSWLDSPELAFLTITLAKLAVHNPGLAQGYMPLRVFDRHFQRIKNLLAYYKDMDDDARLALQLLARRLPVHIGGDFKGRWGIGTGLCGVAGISCIPSAIKPDGKDIKEMFDYFLGKTVLTCRVPVPTWSPVAPPYGYAMVLDEGTNTFGAKGLGELLWDVCQAKGDGYIFVNNRELQKDVFFSIPRKLADKLPVGWRKFCGNRVIVHNYEQYIYSAEKKRDAATFSEARRLLLETVFPFWRVGTVKADSYQQWKHGLRGQTKPQYAGKILYGDLSGLPIHL
jgi:hypothetical protein